MIQRVLSISREFPIQSQGILIPISGTFRLQHTLLGYPVWAQDIPRFVADFMEKCDLTGKTVIPFATYGMSGINWTMKHLKQVCAGAEIRLPFDSGVFKKGNYAEWIKQVQTVCRDGDIYSKTTSDFISGLQQTQ